MSRMRLRASSTGAGALQPDLFSLPERLLLRAELAPQVWVRWHHVLMFVQPDTVVRWQRERFRRVWARLFEGF
jgi:hypothetical protein